MNELKFGSNGIRAKATSQVFCQKNLIRIANTISQWTRKKSGKEKPTILIAHDTRESCFRIKKDLAHGFNLFGCNVVDAGTLPTPTTILLTREQLEIDSSLVISASHNPAQDNGIKIFSKNGTLSEEDETYISKIYDNIDKLKKRTNLYGTTKQYDKSADFYINKITNMFPQNFMLGKTIALDCANGAAWDIAPRIFTAHGANIITIGNKPDGNNINVNCGSQHPENVTEAIIQNNADIGFSFDGDADRLIAVTSEGILKNGDDILAILSNLIRTDSIVGTSMTNAGLEKYFKTKGKTLIRCDVGEKQVVRTMGKNKLPLGGEPSGHIIIKSYLPASDGIFAALKLVEAITISNNWTLRSFDRFAQKLINITIKHRLPLDKPPCSYILSQHKTNLKNGRIVVRYSGTEPLLRVMVEAKSETEAENTAQSLASKLKQVLDT